MPSRRSKQVSSKVNLIQSMACNASCGGMQDILSNLARSLRPYAKQLSRYARAEFLKRCCALCWLRATTSITAPATGTPLASGECLFLCTATRSPSTLYQGGQGRNPTDLCYPLAIEFEDRRTCELEVDL
eukprot:1137430-Pelagomonas_calceolata.AAC.4